MKEIWMKKRMRMKKIMGVGKCERSPYGFT
jgi:hypothetical protein